MTPLRKRLPVYLAVSAALWLMAMGLVWRINHSRSGTSLDDLSSDVSARNESRRYLKVFKDGTKIGYMILSRAAGESLLVYREQVVLKVSLAGMSREIFAQNFAGIDSVGKTLTIMSCRIQSGSHMYLFNGEIHEDSLFIRVRKNETAPWRKGMFEVKGDIVPPAALPFRLATMTGPADTVNVFDPVDFTPRRVAIARAGPEQILTRGRMRTLERFDLAYDGIRSTVWLDSLGFFEKGTGMLLFGLALGGFEIEAADTRDVFLLPLETHFGRAEVENFALRPGGTIKHPRACTYLKVRLDGIRAANIDTEAPNKEVVSLNPVTLAIRSEPAVSGGDRLLEMLRTVKADTALLGSSDFIQPHDARMKRTAHSIVGAEADTLAAARAISRWVYEHMKKDSTVSITRSIDLLRNPIGGRDEHVKLFAALARSMGIPVQINLGLAYEGGVFRYHSWPSVFAGGTWRDLDPWYGQDTADAARIALVRGDFERLVEYLRLVNSFTVTILDSR